MTGYPVDLSDQVGQDVRLGDVFRAASRARRRFFHPALGCLLLMLLILFALYGGIQAVSYLGRRTAIANDNMALLMAVGMVVWLAQVLTGILVNWPLTAGFQWSVVCAFDGRSPTPGDLLHGFRTRFGGLALLGLLDLLTRFGAILIMMMLAFCIMMPTAFAGMSGGKPGPIGFAIGVGMVVGGLVALVVMLAVQMMFFLTPLFALTEGRPSVGDCLRYNWRVIKARFWPFVLVCLLPLLLGIGMAIVLVPAVILIVYLAGHGELMVAMMIGAVLLALALCASIWFGVYVTFVKAAFFRASYGYTLALPEIGPAAPAAAWTAEPTSEASTFGPPGA